MSQLAKKFTIDQAKTIRSTALAVYTQSRSRVAIRRLMKDAEFSGYSLCLTGLGLGLMDFMDQPDKFQKSNLKTYKSGIIVGFTETQLDLRHSFEHMYRERDLAPLSKLLNTGGIAWCEFYFRKFQYEELNSKRLAPLKPRIMESIPKKWHPAFKRSTSRYAFINQSGRKEGQDLIRVLAVAVCEQTNGILAYHKHWLRYPKG